MKNHKVDYDQLVGLYIEEPLAAFIGTDTSKSLVFRAHALTGRHMYVVKKQSKTHEVFANVADAINCYNEL